MYRPFDISSPIVCWHTCCRPWTTWACWVWIWTGVVAPLGDCTMVCWIWAGPLCCGNWTIRTWNWGCWSCVPIGTRGCRFVVVRFTVDVRAAMAVGEDPVATKQKRKLQLLKASTFTLLTQLVKWEKISSFNSASLPSPNLFLTTPPVFSASSWRKQEFKTTTSFYDSLVSYVARNVCEGAWREHTTN